MASKLIVAGTAALVAIATAACGGSGAGSSGSSGSSGSGGSGGSGGSSGSGVTPSSAPKSVAISSAKVGSLGTVLVDEHGHVLYVFGPDKHIKVTCNADCQSVWPPAAAPATGAAKAGGSARQSLIGSARNPAGGRIVTYNGWPLYTYVSDTTAGEANGEALDLNGGHWYVITPAGQVITKK